MRLQPFFQRHIHVRQAQNLMPVLHVCPGLIHVRPCYVSFRLCCSVRTQCLEFKTNLSRHCTGIHILAIGIKKCTCSSAVPCFILINWKPDAWVNLGTCHLFPVPWKEAKLLQVQPWTRYNACTWVSCSFIASMLQFQFQYFKCWVQPGFNPWHVVLQIAAVPTKQTSCKSNELSKFFSQR